MPETIARRVGRPRVNATAGDRVSPVLLTEDMLRAAEDAVSSPVADGMDSGTQESTSRAAPVSRRGMPRRVRLVEPDPTVAGTDAGEVDAAATPSPDELNALLDALDAPSSGKPASTRGPSLSGAELNAAPPKPPTGFWKRQKERFFGAARGVHAPGAGLLGLSPVPDMIEDNAYLSASGRLLEADQGDDRDPSEWYARETLRSLDGAVFPGLKRAQWLTDNVGVADMDSAIAAGRFPKGTTFEDVVRQKAAAAYQSDVRRVQRHQQGQAWRTDADKTLLASAADFFADQPAFMQEMSLRYGVGLLPRILTDARKRASAQAYFDDAGALQFREGISSGRALYEAGMDGAIEYVSERTGKLLSKIPGGVGRVARRVTRGKLDDAAAAAMGRLGATKLGKGVQTVAARLGEVPRHGLAGAIRQARRVTGQDAPWWEWGEELIGGQARAAMGLYENLTDERSQALDGAGFLERRKLMAKWAWDDLIEQTPAMMLAFSVMPGVQVALGAASGPPKKVQLDAAGETFWDGFRKQRLSYLRKDRGMRQATREFFDPSAADSEADWLEDERDVGVIAAAYSDAVGGVDLSSEQGRNDAMAMASQTRRQLRLAARRSQYTEDQLRTMGATEEEVAAVFADVDPDDPGATRLADEASEGVMQALVERFAGDNERSWILERVEARAAFDAFEQFKTARDTIVQAVRDSGASEDMVDAVRGAKDGFDLQDALVDWRMDQAIGNGASAEFARAWAEAEVFGDEARLSELQQEMDDLMTDRKSAEEQRERRLSAEEEIERQQYITERIERIMSSANRLWDDLGVVDDADFRARNADLLTGLEEAIRDGHVGRVKNLTAHLEKVLKAYQRRQNKLRRNAPKHMDAARAADALAARAKKPLLAPAAEVAARPDPNPADAMNDTRNTAVVNALASGLPAEAAMAVGDAADKAALDQAAAGDVDVADAEAAVAKHEMSAAAAAKRDAQKAKMRKRVMASGKENYAAALRRLKRGDRNDLVLLTLYAQQAEMNPQRVYDDLVRAGMSGAKARRLVKDRFGSFLEKSAAARADRSDDAMQRLGGLVMDAGGIRRYARNERGVERLEAEYADVPVAFRRKDGMPLDLMLQHLQYMGWMEGASESDLVRALVNETERRKSGMSEAEWYARKKAEAENADAPLSDEDKRAAKVAADAIAKDIERRRKEQDATIDRMRATRAENAPTEAPLTDGQRTALREVASAGSFDAFKGSLMRSKRASLIGQLRGNKPSQSSVSQADLMSALWGLAGAAARPKDTTERANPDAVLWRWVQSNAAADAAAPGGQGEAAAKPEDSAPAPLPAPSTPPPAASAAGMPDPAVQSVARALTKDRKAAIPPATTGDAARADRRSKERAKEDAEIDDLWKQLNKLGSRMSLGVDPDVAIIGTKLAAVYIKKGMRNFRDFASVAKQQLGENWQKFRDMLLSFWQGAAADREFDAVRDDIEDLTRKQADAILARMEEDDVRTSEPATEPAAAESPASAQPEASPVAEPVTKTPDMPEQGFNGALTPQATGGTFGSGPGQAGQTDAALGREDVSDNERQNDIPQADGRAATSGTGKTSNERKARRIARPGGGEGGRTNVRGDGARQQGDLFGPVQGQGVGRNPAVPATGAVGGRVDPVGPERGSTAGSGGARRIGRSGNAGTARSGRVGRGDGRRVRGDDGKPDAIVPVEPADSTTPADVPTAPDGDAPVGDHKIDADTLGTGGAVEKTRRNIAAIRILKELHRDGRKATEAERAQLALFVGWGDTAIANNIWPSKDKAVSAAWKAFADELRGLLTDAEWNAARKSTIAAHYTSATVVANIYRALRKFGFAGGSALEAGCGIGNFFGLVPDDLRGAVRFTGIELDPISAGIARALYPDQDIRHADFVQWDAPNGSFDIALGNPPFADVTILADPAYRARRFKLHDYFIAKTVDKVRPGGVLVLVTSHGTLDKGNSAAREYIGARADLIGAVRLPQSAFKQNANTEVVTDVLFLRRRADNEPAAGAAWSRLREVSTADGKTAMINEYFADHPEMILGELRMSGTMYRGDELTVVAPAGDIDAAFAAAVDRLPPGGYVQRQQTTASQDASMAPDFTEEGQYYMDGATLMRHVDKHAVRVVARSRDKASGEDVLTKAGMQVMPDYIRLRDALRALLAAQQRGCSDGELAGLQADAQRYYDRFVRKHGPLNAKTVVTVERADGEKREVVRLAMRPILQGDPFHPLVMGSELYDDAGKRGRMGPMYSERVLSPPAPLAQKADTVEDAVAQVLNALGRLDMDAVAEQAGVSVGDAVAQLGTRVYLNPESGAWELAEEYLSGDVKTKLDKAREESARNPAYERNVRALEAVRPADLAPRQIYIGLGSAMTEPTDVTDFAREVIGLTNAEAQHTSVGQVNAWELSGSEMADGSRRFSTDRRTSRQLLTAALNKRVVEVYDELSDGSRELNRPATAAAQMKVRLIEEEWEKWIWRDAARAERLAAIYNERANRRVKRMFDGSHLKLTGGSLQFRPHAHQLAVAWRIISAGNTYMAHEVGSGKTFASAIAGREMKRLGIIKKPMYVVPNHVLQQFAAEYLMIYPTARILVADDHNFAASRRRMFIGQVAGQDWDAVFISHSAFKLVGVTPAFEIGYLRRMLDDYQDSLRSGNKKTKDIEKAMERLTQRLSSLSAMRRDPGVNFEDMGVDFLFVDEAHKYRKLQIVTNQTRIKGISPDGSQQAWDLYLKSRYLEGRAPGRSMAMMSGTPLTNTIGEMYSLLRFMNEGALSQMGVGHFDVWAATFGKVIQQLEATPQGTYMPQTRFARFVNLAQLVQMWSEVGDSVRSRDIADLVARIPKLKTGRRQIVVCTESAKQKAYKRHLAQRIEAIAKRKGPPQKGDDIILSVIGDGRHAAIDDRYVSGGEPNPDGKLETMIKSIHKIWKNTRADALTQVVFSDLGVHGTDAADRRGFSAYRQIMDSLQELGVPASEIAAIQDYPKLSDKLALFDRVNAGKVRVLLGSSEALGTGANIQRRLVALHHLDAPYVPADLLQREGRILRQGNQNKDVQIFAYVTKGSYDETMWQLLETKMRFIEQIVSGKVANGMEMEDISGEADAFEEAKALTSDNPYVLELAGLNAEINRLSMMQASHRDDVLAVTQQLKAVAAKLDLLRRQMPFARETAAMYRDTRGDKFEATIDGQVTDSRKDAGSAIIGHMPEMMRANAKIIPVGVIGGYHVRLVPSIFRGERVGIEVLGAGTGSDNTRIQENETLEVAAVTPLGLIARIEHMAESLSRSPVRIANEIREAEVLQARGRSDAEAIEFPYADQLAAKEARRTFVTRMVAAPQDADAIEAQWRDFEAQNAKHDEVAADETAADDDAGDSGAMAVRESGIEYGADRWAGVNPWPKGFPRAAVMSSVIKLRGVRYYAAAKAGDLESAARVVSRLVKRDKVLSMVAGVDRPIFVPVHAEEQSGRNKLPMVFAAYLADRVPGAELSHDIVQVNIAGHTGMDAAGRLMTPVLFDGPVERGRNYVVVDDVLTSGATVAGLRAHIERGGGHVVGVAALAASGHATTGYGGHVAIEADTMDRLAELFDVRALGDVLSGYDIAPTVAHLTNSQGRYIASLAGKSGDRAANVERLRTRFAAARRARGGGLVPGVLAEASGPLNERVRETLSARGVPAETLGQAVKEVGRQLDLLVPGGVRAPGESEPIGAERPAAAVSAGVARRVGRRNLTPLEKRHVARQAFDAISKARKQGAEALTPGERKSISDAFNYGVGISNVIHELYTNADFAWPIRGAVVQSPEDVLALMSPLRSPYRESLKALYLDSKQRVIAAKVLTVGLLDSSLFHPREVFGAAPRGTSMVVLAHNHPSGDPRPSSEDLSVTRKLVEAGKVLGYQVMDHVITNGGRYYSMREQGMVDFDGEMLYNDGSTLSRDMRVKQSETHSVDRSAIRSQAEWEAIPMSDLPLVLDPQDAWQIGQAMRQQGENHLHVMLTGVKSNVVAVYRLEMDIPTDNTAAAAVARSQLAMRVGSVAIGEPAASMVLYYPGSREDALAFARFMAPVAATINIPLLDVVYDSGETGVMQPYSSLRRNDELPQGGVVKESPAGGYEAGATDGRSEVFYRAGQVDETGVKPWSSWTQVPEIAQAYTETGVGHGGPRIRSVRATVGNVLDLTQGLGGRRIAQAIGLDAERAQEIDDAGTRYPWEESKRLRAEIVAAGYDAIRYLDDYPDGSETVVLINPQDVVELDVDASTGMRVRESGAAYDAAGQSSVGADVAGEPAATGVDRAAYADLLETLERVRRSSDRAVAIGQAIERRTAKERYARLRATVRGNEQAKVAAEVQKMRIRNEAAVAAYADKARHKVDEAKRVLLAQAEKAYADVTGETLGADPADSLGDLIGRVFRHGKDAGAAKRHIADVRLAVRAVVDALENSMKEKIGGPEAFVRRLLAISQQMDDLAFTFEKLNEGERKRALRAEYRMWAGDQLAAAALASVNDDPTAVHEALREYVDLLLGQHYRKEMRKLFGGNMKKKTLPTGREIMAPVPGRVVVDRMVDEFRAPMRALQGEFDAANLKPYTWRQLKGWHDRAQGLLASDRGMREFISQRHRVRRKEMVDYAGAEIEEGEEPLPAAETRTPSHPGAMRRKRWANGGQQTRVMLLGGGRDDTLTAEVLYDTMRAANARQMAIEQTERDALDAKMVAMGVSADDLLRMKTELIEVKLPGNQTARLSRVEMMTLYGMMQDSDARVKVMHNGWVPKRLRYVVDSVVKGFGETPEDAIEMAQDIVKLATAPLTEKEKLLATWMVERMTGLGHLGNETSRKINGVSIFNSPRHFPLIGAVRRDKEDPQNEAAELLEGSMLRRQMVDRMGMTRERQSHRHLIMISDIMDVFNQHARNMSVYVAWAIPYRDALKLLSPGRAQSAIVARWGTAAVNDLKTTLALATYQEAHSDHWNGFDRFAAAAQRLMAVRILGLRMSSILLNRIGGSMLLWGRLWRDSHGDAMRFAGRLRVPFVLTRSERAIREKLLTNGYLKDRWVVSPFSTFGNLAKRYEDARVTAGQTRLRARMARRWGKMQEWSMSGMARAEMRNAIDLWRTLEKRDGARKMTEAEMLDTVERFTRETQNPSTAMEETGVYRALKKNPAMGLVLPFFGQPAVVADLLTRQVARYRRLRSTGQTAKAIDEMSGTLLSVLLAALYAVVQRAMFRRVGRGKRGAELVFGDDREKLAMAADATRECIDMLIPGGGRVADTAFAIGRQGLTGKADLYYSASRIESLVERPWNSTLGAAKKLVGMAHGSRVSHADVERLALDVADVVASMTGAPWGGIEQAVMTASGAFGHSLGRKSERGSGDAATGRPVRARRIQVRRTPAR